MKVYETKDIRNIAVCGSSGSGKTQFTESALYTCGVTNRLGRVEEKNTVSDYDPLEKERASSINSSVISFENGGVKLNIIDSPGYADFVGQPVAALTVCECVLLIINPHEGVDVTTKKIWNIAVAEKKPVIIYINFMDNAPGEFSALVDSLKEKLSQNMAPVTVPVGKAENFKGVINLLKKKAVIEGKEQEIPADMKDEANSHAESLMESVAVSDDSLTEKFLEGQPLQEDELRKGLTGGLTAGKIIPVFCGSAVNGYGVKELLNFLGKFAPSPLDSASDVYKMDPSGKFKALVFKAEAQQHVGQVNYIKIFSGSLSEGDYIVNLRDKNKQRINQIVLKRGEDNIKVSKSFTGDICALIKFGDLKINDTIASDDSEKALEEIKFPQPVVERGVYPKSKGDEEKVAKGFANIREEDPTLNFGFESQTKEMVLRGMGSLQLDLMVKKLKNRYDAEVELRPPRIAYRETAGRKVESVRGKYKKQTGGRGQYGDCVINLFPLERGNGFEFVNGIVGGKIPGNYIPAIEKGIKDAMKKGVIAGYPVEDIKISVFDGSYHEVDSSDMAFQVAGSLAFQEAIKQASPFILEPIMKVKITVSKDYMGAVMGDLNSRRGRVLGMEPAGTLQSINALIPKQALTTYAEDLRSLTSGEAEYISEFDHYEAVPHDVQAQLVEKYQKEKGEGR